MSAETKKLLELAARAMGYTWSKKIQQERLLFNPPLYDLWITTEGKGSTAWNPIENSDDCFGMECQLEIEALYTRDGVRCYGSTFRIAEKLSDHNNNRVAARRMASTRVAAELGRRTK